MLMRHLWISYEDPVPDWSVCALVLGRAPSNYLTWRSLIGQHTCWGQCHQTKIDMERSDWAALQAVVEQAGLPH